MWNSVLLDGVKWSFDRSSPPLMDDNNHTEDDETQFRSWDFKSHQQTNYADWTNKQDGQDDDAEDLFLRHNSVDRRTNSYPSAAELFRNFVGDEGADRMEFYINHLTMEGCDANNIAAVLMSEADDQESSSSQNDVVYRPPFPLLETITEETAEELQLDMSDSSSSLTMEESSESPSSNSGRWGWGWGWLNTSDDDSSSVIHVPVGEESSPAAVASASVNQTELLVGIKSGIYHPDGGLDVDDFDLFNDDDQPDQDDEWSERDQEVPKKKRRIGRSMDEDDGGEESGSSRSPSVTDSLIQFEALEKELGNDEQSEMVIFRTSATSLPFEDADDEILSPEVDPEVFLDCQEHCDKTLVEISRLVETSSGHFSDYSDELQSVQLKQQQQQQEEKRRISADGQHSTTCGSYTPPLSRTWSSMPSLDCAQMDEECVENEEEKEEEERMRRSKSHDDVTDEMVVMMMTMEASGRSHNNNMNKLNRISQGQNAAERPSPPWVFTFDPPSRTDDYQDDEEEDDEDDQVNEVDEDDDDEDTHWEPDGYLNSDIEEYDTGSNSDDDDDDDNNEEEDYSTERCDRFDELGLGFISGRSQRMRSFRSYGDSLNLLDTTDDGGLQHSTSSSSCSPDRSSPEEDHRLHPSSSRSRRSVEALSEDSGYGDASGSCCLPSNRRSPVQQDKRATCEELRLAGPSTPPTIASQQIHHLHLLHQQTLELPSLTICPPDGSSPSSSPRSSSLASLTLTKTSSDRQWLPEVDVNRSIRQKQPQQDVGVLVVGISQERENVDGQMEWKECQVQSALLLRRQPRCRPTPLSLKEAEEFLISQEDRAPEVINDGQSRCGVPGICIDLESEMSHTLERNDGDNDAGGGGDGDGNVVVVPIVVAPNVAATTTTTSTNDDILLQDGRDGTDLEASKFNPQIGSSDRWEVPDVGEAATSITRCATERTADHQADEKKQQQHSLHSILASPPSTSPALVADGSDFIQPPDAYAQHNCSSLDHNVTYSTDQSSIAMDSAFYPAPVVLKRYGPRQEVEVYISQQQLPVDQVDNAKRPLSDANISSSSPIAGTASAIRGVHFSPVVSAVNWRESYLNQSEDESDAGDSDSSSNRPTRPVLPAKRDQPHSVVVGNESAELPTKVRVAEVSPSVAQRVKLSSDPLVSSPSDVVSADGQDSGRNGGNSNSCTTTAATNSKKAPLFQRFSLSRLSARMSATFSRSESKRESVKKAASTECPLPTESKNVVFNAESPPPTTMTTAASCSSSSTAAKNSNGKEKKNSKNKTSNQQPEPIEAKPSGKKIDDFKVVKEPKKRFFSRSPFQRSSSTPPASNNAAGSSRAEGSTVQTRAAVSASGKDSGANLSSNGCHQVAVSDEKLEIHHQEPVAKQPTTTWSSSGSSGFSNDVIRAPPKDSVDAIDDSRSSVAGSNTPDGSPDGCRRSSSPISHRHSTSLPPPPIPSPRSKVQLASHAKPPLPPQTKPRTIHARKNYLSAADQLQQQQQQQSPPPVPMVSSAGLQHALQHFKESARMERERLANSVPDLAAPSTPTPTPRPTSDCIDRRDATTLEDSSSSAGGRAPTLVQPSSPVRPLIFAGSRERARQAVLSRASSVESAWNATASQAALNLSRRNIASSGSQDGVNIGCNNGTTQGHGPTKSRPVVPGLLETNLDSVPSSYTPSSSLAARHFFNNDETNLDELIQNLQLFCSNNNNNNNNNSRRGGGDVDYSTAQTLSVEAGSSATTNTDKRFKSMLNLGSSSAPVSVQPDIDMMLTDPASSSNSSIRAPDTNRAKSMEFLLDEDNKSTVQVPENQLKKCGERKMSEHELRIQRSLQKLNVPEWYKNNARSALGHSSTPSATTSNGSSSVTSTGVVRRRDYHGGSVSSRNGGGWSGLSASNRDAGTASSMTSLGSALSRSGTPTRVVIPTRVRPDWRNIKSSRESLSSPAETCSSPGWNGPTSLSSTQQTFARWGSGRSSYSTCPSPAPSNSSSASAYRTSLLNQHGRAPYLGWRSQERLNNTPAPLSIYQSPAERLASTLLTTTAAIKTGPAGADGQHRTEGEVIPPQHVTHQQQQQQQEEVDEGVRSSIRQVTSAIVHYVSESSDGDQPPSPASRNGLSRSPERHPLEALSRSPSPRRQRCVWVESSFIGGPTNTSPNTSRHRPAAPASPIRPESPPSSSGSSHHSHHPRTSTTNNGRPGLSDRTVVGPLSATERDDGWSSPEAKTRLPPSPQPPPPISATLDDVLNSLLGLAPPPIHAPLRRPVSQPTIHNKQVHHQQQQQDQQQQQPYQRQHQQMRSSSSNNNNPASGVIQEARSFNDLRSSTYNSSTSSNK